MTYSDVKTILERNKKALKNNTMIVPVKSFDGFIKDELMFVRKADDMSCTVFRALDGKFYSLTQEQINKFKCVGNC